MEKRHGGDNLSEDVIDLAAHRGRHGQRGYYSLADLPQRGSVAAQSFGCGWPDFDEIFKFYKGQFVVVTGIAGHGKSTFLLNVLLRVARQHGVRSFLYAPENEAYLVEKLKLIWANDETFDHFADSMCFVQSAVPEGYDDPPHTIDWVLDQAVAAVKHDNAEIVMIDPWNELDRAKPKDMMLTDYVGECLRLIKQFCRSLDATVIVVAHPTKAVNEHGGKIASLADIEQSMNWFNKCDNGLIVVREPAMNTAKVISAKVREIGAGRLGSCEFHVDPNTGLFTPMYGTATL
jgi:twinkle protein